VFVSIQTSLSDERLVPALVRLALVGVIAVILDLTIVNVAITVLQRDLHTDVATVHHPRDRLDLRTPRSAQRVAARARRLRRRLDPLRDREYATSSAPMFGSGISLIGALFLLPLYYQQMRGASALEAGLLLAPQGAGMVVGSILVGRLGARTPTLTGLALLIVATVPFLFAAHVDAVLLAVAVRGVGLGLALIPITSASYVGLPREAIPSVTTGVRIFQQVGGALPGGKNTAERQHP
jgi:hypothetical protein